MKRYAIVVSLTLLLLAGLYGYHWVNSEATASVAVQPSRPVSDVLGSATSLVEWQTDLFTTRIPDWLRQTSATESASDSATGSYVVSGGRDKDAQIAVTIARLGNNTLSEVPAVHFRNLRPQEYRPGEMVAAPAGALAYYHIGSYERSVFWQYRGQFVAVVASGSNSERPDTQVALESLLNNWQWSAR